MIYRRRSRQPAAGSWKRTTGGRQRLPAACRVPPAAGLRRQTRSPGRLQFACTALLAVLLACGAAAQQRPSRIISIVPAVTEMLFAIGAGPRVVAVSSYDREPPEVTRLPQVGALLDPDLERILSLRPDLVVIYGSQSDLQEQLTRARIPLYPYVHHVGAGLGHITRTIRELGERTGEKARADSVASAIEGHLTDIQRRVAGRPKPRTLVVFGREPATLRNLYASGGVGFLHDMIETAGGANVFATVKREGVQATSEMLLAAAPEVILELRAEGDDAVDLSAWQSIPAVPAVRARRIVVLAGSEMVIPGPRVAKGTERIARALHPDAF